jgi:hypothetical protein
MDGSGKPCLTEDEIGDGLGHVWVAAAEPTSEMGRSVRDRDMYLLDEATKG